MSIAHLLTHTTDHRFSAFKADLVRLRAQPKVAFDMLAQNPDFCTDAEVAVIFVETATQLGHFAQVKAALPHAPDPSGMLAAQDWADVIPKSPTPWRVLARALAAQDDARAQRWFSRAIETSNGKPALILDLAEFLLKCGKADEAKTHLSRTRVSSHSDLRRKTRLLEAV